MKNIKYYNLYLFISTFLRNIIDIYIPIFLYQRGFEIEIILKIYAIIYFLGIFISSISILIGNRIGYKYILIISSIVTGLSFNIVSNSNSIYLISLIISLSIYTYHPIKHIYGAKMTNNQQKIGNMLIFIYLASALSSVFVIKHITKVYFFIFTIISIIPSIFIKNNPPQKIIYSYSISKENFQFYFFDQFRIIFLLLEPLYLFLLNNHLSYIGILNIIISISSIIYLFFLTHNKKTIKYYKIRNILFAIIIFLKIHIQNNLICLILTFFEGFGIKNSELISTMNLYKSNIKDIEGHILISEMIICLIRSLILIIFIYCNVKLTYIMNLLLIGIFILSFQYKNKISK